MVYHSEPKSTTTNTTGQKQSTPPPQFGRGCETPLGSATGRSKLYELKEGFYENNKEFSNH